MPAAAGGHPHLRGARELGDDAPVFVCSDPGLFISARRGPYGLSLCPSSLHGTVACGSVRLHPVRQRRLVDVAGVRDDPSLEIRDLRAYLRARGHALPRRDRAASPTPSQRLRIPASIEFDLPVVRHVNEVAFIRNLANLEANHPAPRSSYGGAPDFHINRVYTDPVREPWWWGRHWKKAVATSGPSALDVFHNR